MAHASGSKTQLAFIAESAWGTTPATPTMQAIPFKTFALKPVADSFSSGMMTPDRMKKQVSMGVFNCTAELAAEWFPEVYDGFLESVCGKAWDTNVLKIGKVDKFFTIEEFHSDAARARTGKGMVCNKFSLSAKPGFVECAFGFVGKSMALGTASGASVVTAVPERHPADTVSAVLSEGGAPMATITSLEFTLENAVDLAKACNGTTPTGFGVGMASLKGKLNAYFTDDAQLVKFLAGTHSSITIQVGVAADGIYTFDLSNVVYTGADSAVDKEGLLACSLDFEAIYDDSDDSLIVITRTPHNP